MTFFSLPLCKSLFFCWRRNENDGTMSANREVSLTTVEDKIAAQQPNCFKVAGADPVCFSHSFLNDKHGMVTAGTLGRDCTALRTVCVNARLHTRKEAAREHRLRGAFTTLDSVFGMAAAWRRLLKHQDHSFQTTTHNHVAPRNDDRWRRNSMSCRSV